jgi:hypothetical protein
MHRQSFRIGGNQSMSIASFIFIVGLSYYNRITGQALIVTLLHHFSFSCPHEIEAFQSFVIRPRIKGQGPSSLPLLVRKL